MTQNGRINSPKLRPRLSSSEKPITINMSSCLEVEASIKIKYGHEGIMIIFITATYIDFSYDYLCSSDDLFTMQKYESETLLGTNKL